MQASASNQSAPDNFGGPKVTPDNFGGPKAPDNFGGPKISTHSVQFSAPTALGPLSEKITNENKTRLTWKAQITYTSGTPGWLHLSKTTGVLDTNGNESITMSVNTTGLVAGQYHATVAFNWNPVQGSGEQATVSLTV